MYNIYSFIKNNILSTLIIILSIYLFLIFISIFWNWTVDDSFIIFRYAKNFANGYGPVYNIGSDHAEGYTSFLWMILMTIPHLLGIDVVFFSKLLGIISTLAYFVIAFKFTSKLTKFLNTKERYLPNAFVIILLISFIPVSTHAISGMETALFTMLLLLFFYLITLYLDELKNSIATSLIFIGFLLSLTRPEGNLPVLIGFISVLFLIPKTYKQSFVKKIFLFYVLPGSLYFIWRFMYYGTLFPLPFYVKTSANIFSGLGKVINFLLFISVHLGIMIILGFTKIKTKLIPSILAASSLLMFFIFPSHIMGYDWRFLFPTVPFIFIISALGFARFQEIIQLLVKRRIQYILCLLLIIVLLSTGLFYDTSHIIKDRKPFYEKTETAHVILGKYLSGFNSTYNPKLAIGDAGAVPYYSNWYTIDTYGLNDKYIALSRKHDPNYILSQKPDILVLISKDKDVFKPHLSWEQTLYEESLKCGMIKIKTLTFNPKSYYLWILINSTSPVANYMKKWQYVDG